jgi:RHS repeat-associated protein
LTRLCPPDSSGVAPRGIAACFVGIGSLYRFGYSVASPSCHPRAARRFGRRRTGVQSLPAVDIQLDRTWSGADRKRRTNGWTSQAAGVYPGLDRFGRVISQSWLDGVTGSTADGYRPAIVDQIHTYDLASNRLSKRDGRAGASWLGRDWEYSYDSLGRLTEARQGARTGVTGSSQGTWIPAAGGQEWVLDMLGNWTEQRTDLTGNGVFTDALDRSDARSHNLANELTQRVVTAGTLGTGTTNSVTLPLAYDAAGNLAEESTSASTKRRYTHDAWGRLVKVESLDANNAAKPLGTHRFNGLHWRIEKHWHAVPDAADLADRKTTFWYDAAWRVVQETQRDQTNGAGTLEESIIQQVWGARYIDDAVARMRVTGNGSGGVAAGASQELAFQLTDAQFSVIAVATPGKPGVVIDRIAYSPYGEATRTLRSDVNGDGFVNQSDHAGIIRPRNGATIGTAAYVVEADLDRNGVINQLDYDISIADDGKSSSGGVGEAGLFSRGVRNSIGYCGYIFNEDSGLYTVRFRTYSPTLGRWLERDPAGYVDGMDLYEYVRGWAIRLTDPLGLSSSITPASPAAQIELFITNLASQGVPTVRIGIQFARLGFRAEAIAKHFGVSVEVAQSYIDIAEAELALEAALAESAGDSTLQAAVESRYPNGPGRCERAMKGRKEYCADQRGNTPEELARLPRSCGERTTPMPPVELHGRRNCFVFLAQEKRHLACAAARIATLLYCSQATDPSRKDHIEAAIGAWNGAKNCKKRWQECMELNRQCEGR